MKLIKAELRTAFISWSMAIEAKLETVSEMFNWDKINKLLKEAE